ncbi:MAG: enhanced entry protein [Gammaproteobacteria bacterium]
MMCKRIIICLVIIFGLLTFNLTLANNQRVKQKLRFPVGCKPTGYKFDFYNVVFKPSALRYSQTVYFIRNVSGRPVYMLQVHDGSEPYIIYMNGLIVPNKWSVLSVSEDQVKYICTNYTKANRNHRVINCQNALNICEFSRSRFGTNHRGTYWLTMNQSREAAVRITRFHGILLSDPRQIEAQIKNEIGDNPEE